MLSSCYANVQRRIEPLEFALKRQGEITGILHGLSQLGKPRLKEKDMIEQRSAEKSIFPMSIQDAHIAEILDLVYAQIATS